MESNQPLSKKERNEQRRQERLAKEMEMNKSKNIGRIAFWIIIALIIGGTIFAVTYFAKYRTSSEVTPSQGGELGVVPAITVNDQIKGNSNAKVTLIEYSDFQCPACATYYPLLKQISTEYGDKIAIVYRHFPLRQIHRNAQLAAQAAEAAGLQGKFWQMHDLLFTEQQSWSKDIRPEAAFVNYAKKLFLDIDRFESDLKSKAVVEKVNQDYSGGLNAGVNATPSFALNGTLVQNPGSYAALKEMLDTALAQ